LKNERKTKMNMKKVIAVLLSVMLVVACLPLNAVAAEGTKFVVEVSSGAEVEAGAEVEFAVYIVNSAAVEGGIAGYEFSLDIPEGLEYVAASAKVSGAEAGFVFGKEPFNETLLKTAAYGADGYKGEKLLVLTFKCKVTETAAGDMTVTLKDPIVLNMDSDSLDAEVESAKVSVHVCTLTEVAAKAATCTEAGNEAYKKCECGKLYDMEGNPIDEIPVIPALGHGEADADGKCPVCGEKIGDSVEEILAKIAAEVEEALADLKATEDGENTPEALQAKIDKIVAEIVAKYQDVTYVVVVDADSFTAAADGKNGAASYAVTLTLGGVDTTVYGDVTITANAVKSNKVFIPRLFTVTVECDEGATVNTSKTFKIAFGAARTIKITAEEGYEVVDVLLNGKSVGAVEKLTIKPAVRNYSVKVICAAVDAE